MSLGRFLGSVGAVALGALVTFGSANAVTIPIVPGGTFVLAPNNDYVYSPPTIPTTGTDTFNFIYAGGFANAVNSTVKIFTGLGSNVFTSITIDWLQGATSLVAGPLPVPQFGLVLPLPSFTTNAATLYHLVINWVKPAGASGATRYETTVETGPGTISGTPLPPAALMFVSALAGLGLLGRRRAAKNKALAS